jgi:hypothetical protein
MSSAESSNLANSVLVLQSALVSLQEHATQRDQCPGEYSKSEWLSTRRAIITLAQKLTSSLAKLDSHLERPLDLDGGFAFNSPEEALRKAIEGAQNLSQSTGKVQSVGRCLKSNTLRGHLNSLNKVREGLRYLSTDTTYCGLSTGSHIPLTTGTISHQPRPGRAEGVVPFITLDGVSGQYPFTFRCDAYPSAPPSSCSPQAAPWLLPSDGVAWYDVGGRN